MKNTKEAIHNVLSPINKTSYDTYTWLLKPNPIHIRIYNQCVENYYNLRGKTRIIHNL